MDRRLQADYFTVLSRVFFVRYDASLFSLVRFCVSGGRQGNFRRRIDGTLYECVPHGANS